MTAKEYVKEKYPKSRAERHRELNGKTYWLIRNRNNTMPISSGKSEKNAWENAKNHIKENETR